MDAAYAESDQRKYYVPLRQGGPADLPAHRVRESSHGTGAAWHAGLADPQGAGVGHRRHAGNQRRRRELVCRTGVSRALEAACRVDAESLTCDTSLSLIRSVSPSWRPAMARCIGNPPVSSLGAFSGDQWVKRQRPRTSRSFTDPTRFVLSRPPSNWCPAATALRSRDAEPPPPPACGLPH
jgi:hypothetical protein